MEKMKDIFEWIVAYIFVAWMFFVITGLAYKITKFAWGF